MNDGLLQQALELPYSERAELLRSLEPVPTDEVRSAWNAEIDARVAAVERGDLAVRPWRDALADARRSLKESRRK